MNIKLLQIDYTCPYQNLKIVNTIKFANTQVKQLYKEKIKRFNELNFINLFFLFIFY